MIHHHHVRADTEVDVVSEGLGGGGVGVGWWLGSLRASGKLHCVYARLCWVLPLSTDGCPRILTSGLHHFIGNALITAGIITHRIIKRRMEDG